ncbi:MAG: peptidoglycan recognition protein family protein [Phycisphaerales bacterium]
MARRNRSKSYSRRHRSGGLSTRAKMVWGALIGSMTAVGGVLLMLDTPALGRSDGLAVPPLLASGGSSADLESIFTKPKAIDKARWKAIVIHHSGAPSGNPETIAADHKKLGLNGLGHHFVIGNGSGGMDDGGLQVGYRWLNQYPGAHAGGRKGDWYNQHSVSICLVGNGDRNGFSKAQMTRLSQLISVLCRNLDIPADPQHVLLHSAVAPTTDPGRQFNESWLRQRLAEGN